MGESSRISSAPDTQMELVEDPLRILRLLERLKSSHSLISVSHPGFSEPCSSSILEVDTTRELVLLDELLPFDGQKRLQTDKPLAITGRIQGVRTAFSGVLQEIGYAGGIAFNCLSLPRHIDYEQRRSDYRVRIGAGQSFEVSVEAPGGEHLKGRMYDLSVGGIGVILPAQATVSAGEIMPACRFRLIDDQLLDCPLSIRYARSRREARALRIGGYFLGLTPAQQGAILRAIRIIEREIIRQAPDATLLL
jgi:c-di-GMP-binding flagellar brake protein YcgR